MILKQMPVLIKRIYMKYILRKTFLVAFLYCVSNNLFAQATPLSIGNLNPGDSVVIYYDVTINSGAGSQVSNQGTVSGSNFATFVTDDPKTGAPNDPTITYLNVFPLPVTLYELRAAPKNAGIQVAWNVSFENNMLKYEVEKSNDGRTFAKIGEVAAYNRASNSTYTFFDPNPNSGINYYRLRVIDQSADGKYSMIVRVDMDGKNGNIRIYPNPVVQQTITLQLSNIDKGNYNMVIYNSLGQVAFKQAIVHDGGSTSKNILLPGTLAKGAYTVQVKTENQVYNKGIIIQ